MQIDITAAAVVRSEMENGVHTAHRGAGDAGLAQVGVNEIDLATSQHTANVVQMPAGQIINDANVRSAIEEFVRQRGAYE